MLKTVATTTRTLPSNVSKASYPNCSSRLLHSPRPSNVTRPSPWAGAIPELDSENIGPKHSWINSERDKAAMRPRIEQKMNSPSENPLHKLSNYRVKTSNPRTKYKNSLAAQNSLRPAVHSARIKELANIGMLKEAISVVTTAPTGTTDTIVWNTLLSQLMRAGKRKHAYKIYIEMKRRGFAPDSRTFTTMLKGMDGITKDDWPAHQENLERCHKLYNALESYAESCTDEEEFMYLRHARAAYLRILGKSGNHQQIIDIFYKTNESGPFARDRFLYTAIFQSLLTRKTAEQIGTLSVAEQNATDAKFYWRTLEKDLERGMEIDAYVIPPFLKIMAGGRPVDQQFGLNVVRDFYGVAPPGEDFPPPRLELCDFSLHAILELCNKARKFRLCTYILKQVMDQKRVNPNALPKVTINASHVNEQLIALGQLAAVGSFDESERAVDAVRFLLRTAAVEAQKAPRPGARSEDFSLRADTAMQALNVCWRCGDWERATEIFSLATHHSPEMFLDDGPISNGTKMPQPKRRLLFTTGFALLARTALSTQDKSKMRQCLRMMGTYGSDVHSNEKHVNFYKIERAKATIKLVDAASVDWPKEEVKTWKALKRESHNILSKRIPVERPEREEDALGSEKYIGKLQQAIDFELSTR